MDEQNNPTPVMGAPVPTPVPVVLAPKPASSKRWLWIALISVILVAGAAYAWLWLYPSTPAATPTPSPTATATADPTAGWKTYTNSQFGFEVKYPETFGINATFEQDQKLRIKRLSEPVGAGSSAEAVTVWASAPGSEPKGTAIIFAGKAAYERTVLGEVGGNFLRTVVPLGNVDLIIDRPPMSSLDQILSTFKFTP